MCNKEHKQCLLITIEMDIVWCNKTLNFINFQVIKYFLVWNIYFTFLVDCTFL